MSIDVIQKADTESSYSLGALDEQRWYSILDEFQDASIFQTPPFCTAKSKAERIEHLVMRKAGEVVAVAQIRLVRVPFLNTSIAYILWGPLFHRWNSDPSWDNLGEALAILREEYVMRRKITLRINPYFTVHDNVQLRSLYEAAGFTRDLSNPPKRTVLIGLAASLEELRKGLDKKWRNCLNSAEKQGLEIVEGHDDSLFELFIPVYRRMLSRKGLAETSDVCAFRAMQSLLPNRFKTRVIVALKDNSPCAGAICSAVGRRGVYHFGATAETGMNNKASYLVQWTALQWLKKAGCTEYDLHGTNAEANPGVYSFKMGLCGKNGKEVESIGQFSACNGLRNRLTLALAERANGQLKKMRAIRGRYRKVRG